MNVKQTQVLEDAGRKVATRLSELFNSPVTMSGINGVEGGIQDVLPASNELAQPIVGSVILSHRPQGGVLVVTPPEDARRLLEVLQVCPVPNPTRFDPRAQAAITEMGNIVAASFLSGLADSMNELVDMGAPGFVDDVLGAVLDELLGHVMSAARQVTRITMTFTCHAQPIQVALLMVGVCASRTETQGDR